MSLSKNISDAFGSKKNATFGDMLESVRMNSYGILLVILAIPSALPLPAPGYSIPFGIAIIVLALQLLIGKKSPWFPEKMLQAKLPVSSEGRVLSGMLKFLAFFEKFVHQRFGLFTKSFFKKFFAVIILLCGTSMLIPIPLTNTIPALGVFLMGIGLTEKDGIFTLGGMIVGLAGICLTLAILFLGFETVKLMIDQVF